jgi:hypothetical protein
MEFLHQRNDGSTLLVREEPSGEFDRTTSASVEDTNLVNLDSNAPVTVLCLICHDNIMRCILCIKRIMNDVDLELWERLRNIYRSLEEDYLRLDLWISDSSVSKGPFILELGAPIVKPIQLALLALQADLSLIRADIDGLKQQSELDPESRLHPIEAACRSITSHIRILAEMQSLIHNAQANQFPQIGPGAYLQAQIDDAYEMFEHPRRDFERLEDESIMKGVDNFNTTSSNYRRAECEQCRQCGKIFYFGTLNMHQELRHFRKRPELTPSTSSWPSTSPPFEETSSGPVGFRAEKLPHTATGGSALIEMLEEKAERMFHEFAELCKKKGDEKGTDVPGTAVDLQTTKKLDSHRLQDNIIPPDSINLRVLGTIIYFDANSDLKQWPVTILLDTTSASNFITSNVVYETRNRFDTYFREYNTVCES